MNRESGNINAIPAPEDLLSRPAVDRWTHALAVLVTLAGALYALRLALLSTGYYHDDDVGHYLFARDAWESLSRRWHSWARPGYNLPTLFVVHFGGMTGCRIFSVLQTALAAYLAFLIARRVAPRGGLLLALAPAFVWAQPHPMLLALTTLTETSAALYMALSIWLYMRGNRIWGGLAMGMLILTRYEAMAIAPVPGIFLILDALRSSNWNIGKTLKTWWLWAGMFAIIALPAAYLAYVHLNIHWGVFAPDVSPIQFTKNNVEEYGRGDWDHNLILMVRVSGWAVLGLATAGTVCKFRTAWFPAGMAFALVFINTLIYHFGIVASGGYERFLVPVAAPVGALAALGIQAAVSSRHPYGAAVLFASLEAWIVLVARRESLHWIVSPWYAMRIAWAGAAGAIVAMIVQNSKVRLALGALAAMAALVFIAWQDNISIGPLDLYNDPQRGIMVDAVDAVAKSPHADAPGITGHVMVNFLRPSTLIVYGRENGVDLWKKAKPGTLYFWDYKYGGGTDSPLYAELCTRGRSVWVKSIDVPWGDGHAMAEVFVRLTDAEVAARAMAPLPPTSAPASQPRE